MMTDVNWGGVLAGLTFMTVAAGLVIGIGLLMTSGVGALAMIAGAGAILVISSAFLVFAIAMQQMIPVAKGMQGMNFDFLSNLGISLLVAAPGLLLGGIALLAGAASLAMAIPLLMFSLSPLQSIAGTDWSSLKSFADGLMSVGPAMLAFAGAGLLMFNPMMLIGMATMLGAITVLTSLMSTLGPNLEQGASGIERMAEGVIKLEQAVSSLNMEKLSQLNTIAGSEGIAKLSAAMRGGGESSGSSSSRGGGSNEPIRHIVELQLDGKKIKEIELRDTKHL
jgi:hypothetical protein